jgi:1,2-diacylglycerol 3-beta-galactosyltransferase
LQEEGNIPYVVDNGVGAFETDPAKIADIMADWLAPENKEDFKHMAHRSRALGRPHAVYDIVRDLAQMADELGALAKQLVGPSCCSKKALTVGQLAAA